MYIYSKLRCQNGETTLNYGKAIPQATNGMQVLDLVKQNLRLEQKKVMEMNFVTIHRVLNPIQVWQALLLVCDVVHICHPCPATQAVTCTLIDRICTILAWH